jgi:ribosome-binding factor A
MANPGRRAERLAHQIRNEVAELIERGLNDPRIGFATVTRVEVSPDLHHARVLVSVMGTVEAQKQTLQGLSSAAGYIRHEIGRNLRLRYTPELVFALDHGAEQSEKIETLLQKLKNEE